MRGETCVAVATFFSFTSVLLLIFAHVGQINTSSVPRKLHMVQVNVTNYGIALNAATGIASPGLYVDNASLPLGQRLGLRQLYAWGLYGYCTYEDAQLSGAQCGNHSFATTFTPMDVILSDTPDPYKVPWVTLVPNFSGFKNSATLANMTRAAFYFLFIGTLFAGAALITGVIKHKVTFIISSASSILGTIFLLIGSAVWTAAIGQAESINRIAVGVQTLPVSSHDILTSDAWVSPGSAY
ncbi:hypothetical protein FRB99_000368 [Tulasnella sp. 403]|nr:hypothetical protein FRB99_000368 [Tulasnella sp. 403]